MAKRKNRIPLLVIASVILIACALFYPKKGGIEKPNKNKAKVYEYTEYYVPVTNYWSELSDIKTEELNNKVTIVEKGEINVVSTFLRGRAEMLNEKDIKEIQTGIKDGEIAIVKWSDVTPNLKTISLDGKYLWNKADAKDYTLKVTKETEDKNVSDKQFDPEKLTKLTATGDVILGRTVAKKMATLGFLSPWVKVWERLASADITFADLETPLSDRVNIPYEGMSFVAPSGAIAGLLKSGIDIVALANNHSTNFGTNVFMDTLNLLNKNNIPFVGGGNNTAEAEKVRIIEKNGIKWAFLDYNSIIGAIGATEDSPGTAEFDIKPWAQVDNEDDIQKIETAIAAAKNPANSGAGKADVVVVEFHWGVEYTTEPIQSQINVAHRAIDAGADLIIGTHPHAVQGSEFYKGKYITYSLGNFIFDQEWSQGTKEGTVLESYFYGPKQVAANLVPVLISNYHQPEFLDSITGRSIIERIKSASTGL